MLHSLNYRKKEHLCKPSETSKANRPPAVFSFRCKSKWTINPLSSIIIYIMKAALPFPLAKQLRDLGERLQLARLRRRYSATTVAARAGITRMTLYKVEKGDPGVSVGTYASVLRVLGLPNDLDLLARDDVLGRKLQDLELPVRKIAPARKTTL